jgi:hypothetical protein
MRRAGEHLEVIVEDNGVGFAPDKPGGASGKIEGFGLFSIRERLNYCGGRMEIESIPGQVTRVILTIPLQSDREQEVSRPQAAATTKVAPLPETMSSLPGVHLSEVDPLFLDPKLGENQCSRRI